MKNFVSAAIGSLLLLVTSTSTSAQPLCLHHDSLDWLMIDSPVVVRAKLIGFTPIDKHPALSELRVDVLETIRGDVGRELRIPIETQREAYWIKASVKSGKDVLLFLVREPRGYQHPDAHKVIEEYDPPLYYRSRLTLDGSLNVFTLEAKSLRDREQILRTARHLASQKIVRKPASYRFQLMNSDSLTVPLNDRMESIAKRWCHSLHAVERRYGQSIQWGFKRHRNKPFESGYWFATLKSPGGAIRFGLLIDHESEKPYAVILNGSEVVRVNKVSLGAKTLRIQFADGDSTIAATVDHDANTMTGTWRLRGVDHRIELPFFASMKADRKDADYQMWPDSQKFYGKWRMRFSDDTAPAIAEFDTSRRGTFGHKDVREYGGRMLTGDGLFRLLSGDIVDGKLELSAFDGQQAIRLWAEIDGDDLKGHYWVNGRRETWSAVRDQKAELPNVYTRTLNR